MPPDPQPDVLDHPPDPEPFSFTPSRGDCLVAALRARRDQGLVAPAEKTTDGEGSDQ